ncbi:sporulation integral membrane protein YlbJ [Rossellomorea marisflavi]|uniref:sporulation integral membrane protein YlbJ n=1 Tax=Rossellomorea marisflavi TaxID=189381 RepID=UPI0034576F76
MTMTKWKTVLLSGGALMMAAALISMPGESLEASTRGLDIWWKIVFPSLLPFFIVSELLIGFGVVRLIGILLEPLMRPLFKVPGVGGFAWSMGMASGFPAGARLTARLRQERQLSRIEAERLVSFTNSSNPLFIFGAVSAGFFQNATLGIILALSHYLGNVVVGLTMRFYGRNDHEGAERSVRRKFSIKEAFRGLHESRMADQRPLGKLLGDAVSSSIQSLLMIGGFIILFSVLNQVLYHLHITTVLSSAISSLLSFFHLPPNLSIPVIPGLFEITLGSQMTSKLAEVSLFQQAVLVSFLLGFSGFSIQAQVASILAETDIRFKPFFFARILHGVAAAIITIFLFKPLFGRLADGEATGAIPVFSQQTSSFWIDAMDILTKAGPLFTIICLLLYCLLYAKRLGSS